MKKTCTGKLWTYIQITAVHCVLILTIFNNAIANTHPYQVLDQRVSISLKDATVEQAVKAIEAVGNVKFIYSQSRLNISKTVSVRESSIRLDSLLEKVFTPLHIGYSIREDVRTITLFKIKTSDKPTGKIDPVMSTKSLKSVVSGRVLDALTGSPMAGVNVILKGTTSGTTTDSNGAFSIEIEPNSILVFSFIGYKPKEVITDGRSTIEVLLDEDVQNLNEVVVNGGYYTTTKAAQTGNISRIEGTEIQRQPVANSLAAMQGRVPGLEITQDTGVPGGNFKVRIRGTSSISNGNDPLYIIDGVPFVSSTLAMSGTSGMILGSLGTSPLNFINPTSIQSIEVLKDADATAIYGSRGANGVILITTNKPKETKTSVDVNFYSGISHLPRHMSLLNTEQYLQTRRTAFKNDNIIPTNANARDLLVWDTTKYTDWQEKLLCKPASISDAQFSISGGEKNTHFTFGTGYHRETTVFPGSYNDQRFSVQASANNTSANNKLTSSFSINYAVNITNLPRMDLTSRALNLSPNAPATNNEDGSISWTNWSSSYENPLAFTMRKFQANTNNLVANSTITYSIIKNLSAKISMGYTDILMKGVATTPISSLTPGPNLLNASTFSNTSFKNWIIEPQVNWKQETRFGVIDVLTGGTLLSQTSEGLQQTGTGFTSEALMRNIASAATIASSTNYFNQYRYESIFARVNYNVAKKYIINFTARRDGSSRFGPNNRFANFGAIGTAWIWSEENWLKNNATFISYGKLRGSFGTTGNDQLADYQYLDSYSPSSGQYLGSIGLQPTRLSNPNFAWEVNKKLEGALELGFFQNRLLLNTAVYRNRSSNQLVGFPLPATTGFASIQGNFPALVQNQGLEMEFTAHTLDTDELNWTTSFNITVPRNKLVAFPNLENFPSFNTRYVVGEPLSIVKLYNNTGIDSQTGLYSFQDVNSDNTINIQDALIVKFLGQRWYAGLSNSFEFRGIRIDGLFQFVKQSGTNPVTLFGLPGQMSNIPTFALDAWKEPGENTTYQKLSTGGDALTAFNRYTSSQYSIVDASYIRLKNLSISYSLPSRWMSRANLQSTRFFVQGQNLLTITRYKGLDPETQTGRLPPLKVITIGFHVTI